MTDVRETAERNDLFRKTVPLALVKYMGRTKGPHPLLGVGEQILTAIMDLEFPANDSSAHDRGSILVNDQFLVQWEIRENQEGDGVVPWGDDYFPITCCTDIWGARREAGIPWDLDELKPMYKTHTLVVTISST